MNLVVWRGNLWLVENFTLYKCPLETCLHTIFLSVESERVFENYLFNFFQDQQGLCKLRICANRDGAVHGLGGVVAPPLDLKKKIIIVYTFWIFLTFRSKIITFGPPSPWQFTNWPLESNQNKIKKKRKKKAHHFSWWPLYRQTNKIPKISNKSLNCEI